METGSFNPAWQNPRGNVFRIQKCIGHRDAFNPCWCDVQTLGPFVLLGTRQTWSCFAFKLKPKQLENWTVREFMPFAPNGWFFNGNHPLSPHCWRKHWPSFFRLMVHRKTKLITAHRHLNYSYIKLLHFQWLNVDPYAILTKFDEICQC